jgi:hypothetical protein
MFDDAAMYERDRKRLSEQKGNQKFCACPDVGQAVLGNDVGNDAVGEQLNFVLQRQFTLLHAGELKLVAVAALAQKFDFLIEAPMLNLQQGQDLAWIIIVHGRFLTS